ncbi:phage tail tape measure protein [Xenorhabdus doucetiae]|uniref:phage tail tape measure protein n=1 Tax=Xenorhabdus doucetiae TaxID=351671 RepID=UPI002B4122AD|nr:MULTISPECIES: phage tail tape measure protein [unclassified Xenorhabdus]
MANLSTLTVGLLLNATSFRTQITDAYRHAGRESGRFSDKVKKDAKKAESAYLSLGKQIKSVSGQLMLLAGTGFSLGSILTATRKYGQALSDLQAITGATGAQLKQLDENAQRLGRTTEFGAARITEAFKLMASAKPELLQSAAGLTLATEKAVTLAQASGIELPEATRALALSLNQFSASAQQADRFINVLAAGAKYGSSEIGETAQAIKNGGTMAAQAGTRIDERPVTIIPPSVATTLRITWDSADSAVAYEAEWRKDNGNWITAPRTTARSLEVPNVDDGRYQARVRATNAAAISSIWMNTQDTLVGNRKVAPSAPQSLQTTSLLFGIRLDWDFANPTDVLLKTEICYNHNGEDDETLQFADISYPQRTHTLQGLSAGEKLYFRARLVDKSGNASAWTSLVSGAASNDTGWIVEASRDHFLDAETGRRLQAQLNEQAKADARHKQAIAENAQAIERLHDILKELKRRTP